MRRAAVLSVLVGLYAACVAACTTSGSRTAVDAAPEVTVDAAPPAPDADPNACAPYGAPGECMSTTSCAALGDHTSVPGYCPGAADIQCCIVTPDPANNPPPPDGYHGMSDGDVTDDMRTWAIEILHDPVTYPMFSTTTRTFGAQLVLARVEWHVPDGNNPAIHRGVTLYEPN